MAELTSMYGVQATTKTARSNHSRVGSSLAGSHRIIPAVNAVDRRPAPPTGAQSSFFASVRVVAVIVPQGPAVFYLTVRRNGP